MFILGLIIGIILGVAGFWAYNKHLKPIKEENDILDDLYIPAKKTAPQKMAAPKKKTKPKIKDW